MADRATEQPSLGRHSMITVDTICALSGDLDAFANWTVIYFTLLTSFKFDSF